MFVRPLLHEEAVRLNLSRRARHESTRQRAAVLLASNVRTAVPLVRGWLEGIFDYRAGEVPALFTRARAAPPRRKA